RSSPQSFKAQLIAQRLQTLGRDAEYRCPQLPASPSQAIRLAQEVVRDCPPSQLTLIGSSLGGYYATWLAEQFGCRAVLLNPAVAAPHDLKQYVGVTSAWHSDQPFEFRHEYIRELKALAVPRISVPQRYFLLAATGDEVLDWRQMVAHYAGAQQLVINGSDHGISDFERYLDQVLRFCGIAAQGRQ
ncbi:MAG TPA: YqiA/YcfP family alpha/beta fold hydrolase, partial [Burkholderiaceae bacterium]|nr:YqiA/YcfP family alpha/beta fold hydrolase [Burkholderiaceae bacterium]